MLSYVIIALLILIALVILKMVMTTKLSVIKSFMKNDKLDKLCEELPDNITICKQIVELIDNTSVRIEETKDYDSCVYTIYNNKITISTKQAKYTRLQTIAHECIHSIQDKKLLWFNFIFTNIYLIYFFVIAILTVVGSINDKMLQIGILLVLGCVHYSVRSYLELDAMTKARFLAEKYIEKYNVYTEVEKNELMLEYDKMNKIGIPFVNYTILFSDFIKVLSYTIIAILV